MRQSSRHGRLTTDLLAGAALAAARRAVPRRTGQPCRAQTIYYLAVVEGGLSIKSVARAGGTCRSQVRRGLAEIEDQRDCPRADAAIAALSEGIAA